MARTSWIKSSLIFLVAGFGCLLLSGATNSNTSGFETPPPQPGSIKWQIIQNNARQQRELYRTRIPIPGITGSEAVPAHDALFAKRPETMAPPPAPAAASGIFFKFFLFAAVLFFGGVFVRSFFPDVFADLNQRFNPWATALAVAGGHSPKVLAEDESYTRFLASFRIGPSPATSADSTATEVPGREFYARAEKHLATQQKLLSDIRQEASDPARQKMLMDLHLEMGALKEAAGFPGALPIWQVAFALEGLLKQLTGKIRNATSSTLRAVEGGLDLLADLCQPGLKLDQLTDRSFKFLVVDDDLIGRQALSLALNKAFSQPDVVVDGEAALAQASRQAYDVIFLDVQMPGMDGFEVCTKIHETMPNRTTPIVFVTVLNDFDARAQSALSGGSDLLAKPFLIFEVTVKALTLALRGRLRGMVQKPLPEPGQSRPAGSPARIMDRAQPAGSPAIARRPPTTVSAETDEITATFLNRASKNLGPLKEFCRMMLETPDEEKRQNLMAEGFLRINSLIARNGSEVIHPAYLVSVTLEGLLRKLLEDAKHSTPSTLATVATAVDLLDDLCVPGLNASLAVNPPLHLLVVDDDLVARRAIVGALQTTFNKPENVEGGEAALALAREKPFDVIFLDVQMPGMDGFEVCAKIRETVPNRATPVVYVTGLDNFDAYPQMDRNLDTDLMGKPFLTAEITLKALTLALRGRLQQS